MSSGHEAKRVIRMITKEIPKGITLKPLYRLLNYYFSKPYTGGDKVINF